jgi:hypothetical protein
LLRTIILKVVITYDTYSLLRYSSCLPPPELTYDEMLLNTRGEHRIPESISLIIAVSCSRTSSIEVKDSHDVLENFRRCPLLLGILYCGAFLVRGKAVWISDADRELGGHDSE